MARAVKGNIKGFMAKYRAWLQGQALACSKQAATLLVEYIHDKILNEPKTGNWYEIPGKPGEFYQASAAGEWPAWRTGDLFFSVKSEIDMSAIKQGHIHVKVYVDEDELESGEDYDRILYEEMQRKWIPNAIQDLRPQIEAIFKSKAILLHDYAFDPS